MIYSLYTADIKISAAYRQRGGITHLPDRVSFGLQKNAVTSNYLEQVKDVLCLPLAQDLFIQVERKNFQSTRELQRELSTFLFFNSTVDEDLTSYPFSLCRLSSFCLIQCWRIYQIKSWFKKKLVYNINLRWKKKENDSFVMFYRFTLGSSLFFNFSSKCKLCHHTHTPGNNAMNLLLKGCLNGYT